ncbi:hypothetical protein B0H19DRAFT_69507 [Mycena capillaripes]|nr:hypothetical protein B0H19DRAFT_69507 [Mycena capillaripes]
MRNTDVRLTLTQLFNMDYTIDSTTFDNYWDYVLLRIYGTCAQTLLYGVLLMLLGVTAHLLYNRSGAERRGLSVATAAMTILATLQFVFDICVTVLELHIVRLGVEGQLWPAASVLSTTNLYDRFDTAEDFLLVTNNIVTDSLFIYRCFIIWGHNVRIIILPVLMLLATTVLGYLATLYDNRFVPYYIDDRLAFAMVLLTNVVLTVLTAGRIWWMRRDACIVLESAHVRKYDTAIVIILESGAIYCLAIIIYLIAVSVATSDNSPVSAIVRAAMPQIMNIVPTLIIVRTGLRRSVENGDTTQRREAFHRARTDPTPAATFEICAVPPSFVVDIGVADNKDAAAISRAESEKGV